MKLSNKRWFQVKEILFVGVFWMLAFDIFILVRFYGWDQMDKQMVDFRIPISVPMLTAYAAAGGLSIGLLTGIFEIMIIGKKINSRSFGEVVAIKALVYMVVIVSVTFVVRFSAYTKFQEHGISGALKASTQFFSFTYLPIFVYCVFVSLLIGILLQVNKKFGPGILWDLFWGKYHRPKQEQRIFMFLDLTSSTSIAEKLGHVRYSRLLQDCFQDLSDVLLDYQAHIYQFVGDEAVITWTMNNGLAHGNCVFMYYGFCHKLETREDHYLSEYQHFPKFKASLNIGTVSVAEVGDIKSEIAYHGDVLNTAARILEQCTIHKKSLLVSGALERQMVDDQIEFRFMDKIQLRGKVEQVPIYSVEHK